jgi:hypothetical protein
MEFKDFLCASNNLQEFIKEQEKLDAVLKVISPTSTGVCEFGNKFIDDYIKVVEIALGDEFEWFSWFVFENNFGKNKLQVKVNNIEYNITDEKQFFDVFIKMMKDGK